MENHQTSDSENNSSRGFQETIDRLLRQPGEFLERLRRGHCANVYLQLGLLILLGFLADGLIIGSFTGGTQWWAAPLKLLLGIAFSGLMCLPSFYIFFCMSGAQAKLSDAAAVLFSGLALCGLLLIGVAPVAWLFNQASTSVVFIGSLQIVLGLVALYGLRAYLAHALSVWQCSGSSYVRVWFIIFIFVVLQMTTTLRPLIGQSDSFLPQSKRFFLVHWANCFDSEQCAGTDQHTSRNLR